MQALRSALAAASLSSVCGISTLLHSAQAVGPVSIARRLPSALRLLQSGSQRSSSTDAAVSGHAPTSPESHRLARSQSGYIGVWANRRVNGDTFVGVVCHNGRKVRCGPFSSALEAAIARDTLAWELLGPRAQFNFERNPEDGRPDPSTPARPKGKPVAHDVHNAGFQVLSAAKQTDGASGGSTLKATSLSPDNQQGSSSVSQSPSSVAQANSAEPSDGGAAGPGHGSGGTSNGLVVPLLPARFKPFRSRFIGVRKCPGTRWQARIGIGKNEKENLGYFATEIEAAVAFDKACSQLRKEAAVLNFHRDPVTGEPDITRPTNNLRAPPFFQRHPGGAAKAAQMRWKISKDKKEKEKETQKQMSATDSAGSA